MKWFNARLAGAVICGAFLVNGATVQAADMITFDPDGSGPIDPVEVATIDFGPANALSAGTDDAGFPPTVTFTQYSQGTLSSLLDADDNQVMVPGLNEPGGFEITIMSAYAGKADLVANFGDISVYSLGLDAGEPNWVSLFYDDDPSTRADPKTGKGFGDGTKIFEGRIVGVSSTSYFVVDSSAEVDLDQSGDGNDLPGVKTHEGGGHVSVRIEPEYVDNNFFKSLFIEAEFQTESTTPFDKVNPSELFNDVASDPLITSVTPSRGAVNSPNNLDDFQFQTDGSASFIVPEPSTVVLVGLGALAMLRRRRG